MKIYVASSWKNLDYPNVIRQLRIAGHEVYDFRENGFDWSWIDKNWESWTPEQFRENMKHPIALEQFKIDVEAMEWADACVLVLPSGNSSHIEAGYFIGKGKPVITLLRGRPELMYNLASVNCLTIREVKNALCTLKERE